MNKELIFQPLQSGRMSYGKNKTLQQQILWNLELVQSVDFTNNCKPGTEAFHRHSQATLEMYLQRAFLHARAGNKDKCLSLYMKAMATELQRSKTLFFCMPLLDPNDPEVIEQNKKEQQLLDIFTDGLTAVLCFAVPGLLLFL